MPSSPSSAKPLPSLPTFTKSATTWMLDDGAKIHLWKLIHSWLRYGELQTKWASVLNNLLLCILETQLHAPFLLTNDVDQNETTTILPMSIQLFETGSASQSKYLPGANHGTQLQLLTDLPLPSIYGGTIRLYGVPQSLQQKLTDIMAILLYTLYSLRLEADLMRDHQILLSAHLSSQYHTAKPNLIATMDDVGASWRFGILNWILGKRNNKVVEVEKRQSLEKPFRSVLSATINHAPTKGRLSALTSKTIPRKPVGAKTMGNSITSSNIPPATPMPTTATIRPDALEQRQYHRLRLDLEHACISTSPSCIFTVPAIIIALEKEEEALISMKPVISNNRQQQQQKLEMERHNQRLNDQPLRNKLTLLARRSSSILSLRTSTEQLKSTPSSITNLLPQSLTAYTLLRTPYSIINNTSKIGMDHLYLNGTSISDFKHHQRITISYSSYPIGCPDRPCFGPTLCTMQYFLFDDDQSPYADQTLGDTLRQWLDQCGKSCKSRIDRQAQTCNGGCLKKSYGSSQTLNQGPTEQTAPDGTYLDGTNQQQQHRSTNTKVFAFRGCSQPLRDHILCFTHGAFRIQVYFTTTKATPKTTMDNNKGNLTRGADLTCWSECTACGARSAVHKMSQASALFSFAKYLELCLYSTRFMGPRNDMCQHAKTSPSIIARCFGQTVETKPSTTSLSPTMETTEIRFIKEDCQVYRLKGSPLQAVEPPASSPSVPSCPRISSSTLEKWKSNEGMAVDDLFQTLRQQLKDLQQGHPHDDQLAIDGTNWRSTLDMHHQRLTLALQGCGTGGQLCLNNFRRLFTMNASAIVDDWNVWQQSRCLPGQFFTWDGRPDYMNADINQTIHCFPGSAILVRESEPTSIIAFTLSSSEYIEEVIHGQSLESGILNMPAMNTTNVSVPPPTDTSRSSSNGNGQHPSDIKSHEQSHVIDSYHSSMERKYISPSTGSTTETASFRTTVMETVKNNVSDMEQLQLSSMKERWRQATSFSSPPINSKTTPILQKPERAVNLSPYPSATDVQEVPFYHNEDSALHSPPRSLDNAAISSTSSPDVSPYPSPPATEDASKRISSHIKHRFIHGNTEFTCVVYYAENFEALRRSCGVDQLVIESLGRCQLWSTTGGKSRSRFYKTQDDRLVIKEMINAWNIAEKDAFLRFAPKYFDYIKESGKAPTILAKIFGFYSITIRKLNDKKQTLNMDVLVMEQLFYGQSISKMFDFKGIPDRQVDDERKYQQDTTLWDNDWRKEYLLGHVTLEHSRRWMEAAIKRDTQFLASRNIMDYSLLVGIDSTKKELSIGIVDFIGAYTWYKKLESKSKSTINRSREVTVLPPDQYRARFCKEVMDYFVPIPGEFDNIPIDQTNSSIWMK